MNTAQVEPLKIFIGYDPKEIVAFHTLCQSIIDRSLSPVSITPIKLDSLSGFFSRPIDKTMSNEFSFSRFLVPYLCQFQGRAIFMDCDMLVRCDINDVIEHIDDNLAVSVVKHDYKPRNTVKYLGNSQACYPRKNWSSFVVWNCGHDKNKVLTPDLVESSSGKFLHRFEWLADHDIGELPVAWNWLVGEYDYDGSQDVKNAHWTVGGPYFNEYARVDFSDEWAIYKERINFCEQLK